MGGHAGSHEAHEALHTHYQNRNLIFDARSTILRGKDEKLTDICVVLSTKGDTSKGQAFLGEVVNMVRANGLENKVNIEIAYSPKELDANLVYAVIGDKNVNTTLAEAVEIAKKCLA